MRQSCSTYRRPKLLLSYNFKAFCICLNASGCARVVSHMLHRVGQCIYTVYNRTFGTYIFKAFCMCSNASGCACVVSHLLHRVGQCKYTVYDRRFGNPPSKNTLYTPYTTVGLVISLPKIPYTHVYDRRFGNFLSKNTLYTPYTTVGLVIFLPKIPSKHRMHVVLANPMNT